jgi:hypothetical protein
MPFNAMVKTAATIENQAKRVREVGLVGFIVIGELYNDKERRAIIYYTVSHHAGTKYPWLDHKIIRVIGRFEAFTLSIQFIFYFNI